MFKKSLAAVAVLGAFAGSALAADVQLYGLVDLGLNWTQVDKGTTASAWVPVRTPAPASA